MLSAADTALADPLSLRELARQLGARLVLVHKQSEPEEVLAGVEAAVARDPWDRALRYVVRMEDFSPSVAAARAFGVACDGAVQEVLAGGRPAGLAAALDRLAEERRRAAAGAGMTGARMTDAGEFGRVRDEEPDVLSPRTPLLSRNLLRGETLACRYTPYLARTEAMLAWPDAETDLHVTRGETAAGAIELTRTRRVRTPLKVDLEWAHPRSDGFPAMMAHCETLFAAALAAPGGDVVALVGELHWWLAQMNRYRRGSAAIADMLAKLVLECRGIAVPAWRAGIAPDLEACVTPLAAYRAGYHALFCLAPREIG